MLFVDICRNLKVGNISRRSEDQNNTPFNAFKGIS